VSELPVVLVHGGAHGAWCWAPTIKELQAGSLAVDLPPKSMRGVPSIDPAPSELATLTLDDWAASAITDIDEAGIDRFVLVGHSMGGLTICEVARRLPARIAHLVFVSCMVPPEGGLVFEGTPAHSVENVNEALEQAPSDSTARIGMDAEAIRQMFCNDMTEEQTQFVLDHTGAEVMQVFGERVTRRGIPPELPKTYVRLSKDQALWPDDQDLAIERLRESPGGDLQIVELDTGHDVMISAPDQLAPVIDSIASAAS
jgi:pimeloyl-ACP methyl ester carboxylesterase